MVPNYNSAEVQRLCGVRRLLLTIPFNGGSIALALIDSNGMLNGAIAALSNHPETRGKPGASFRPNKQIRGKSMADDLLQLRPHHTESVDLVKICLRVS